MPASAEVSRLRELTGVGVAEYTLDGTAYWTDDQLQDVVDRYRTGDDPDYVYDLNASAGDVLEAWSAQLARAYDVTMDGQSLKRSQMAATVAARAERYRDSAGGGDKIQTVEVKATT